MDLTLTSSEHSKKHLLNTILQKVDQRTNQVGELKLKNQLKYYLKEQILNL
jgi:hypothetical protein